MTHDIPPTLEVCGLSSSSHETWKGGALFLVYCVICVSKVSFSHGVVQQTLVKPVCYGRDSGSGPGMLHDRWGRRVPLINGICAALAQICFLNHAFKPLYPRHEVNISLFSHFLFHPHP